MKNWIEQDKKYIWHPYTQAKEAKNAPPVLIDRAQGIKLYDEKGKFYYDTISSWWCNVHGHNHPEIKKAINKQMDSLEHVLFAGFTHKPAIKLAAKLIELTQNKFNRVFFSDNGSTSVEVALKLSFQYWQNKGNKKKTKFVSLDHGYHGDTVGTMSVSGVDLFNAVFSPLLFSSYKVSSPYCYRCPAKKNKSFCSIECIRPLEKLLKEKHGQICGMIIEPLVMGAAGMIIYPKEYLKGVFRLTSKYNVHLILDEVAVGFGRTGKMFAHQHVPEIKADFLCLSKGITSGCLPISATLTTDEVYRAFYADYDKIKTFFHGHTYTANPLACSAALASLEIFKKERTLGKAAKLMPFFHREMEKFRQLQIVGDVRYIGFIGAIELVKDRSTKEGFGLKRRIGLEVYKRGLKENLVLRPLGDIIYLFLPLSTTKAELKDILKRFYSVIKSLS